MEKIKIENIVADKDFMMRDGLDKKLIAQYKENLGSIVGENPIVVFDTPNSLLLVDGFHRLAAARQLNWATIPTQIRKGSVQDAFAYACLANLRHGKPLKTKERKKAISEYIKINVQLSNVQIANQVGVHDTTIMRYRKELEAQGEIKPQVVRIDTQGKEHIVPISAIAEIDPFGEWFDSHVVDGDMFNILSSYSQKYDLIIVDPPYGITTETWDKQTKFGLLAFTRRWLNLVLQKLKPTGRLFVFWSRKYFFELKPLFDEIKHEYPLNFGGIIVWNFRNVMSRIDNPRKYRLTWEPIFYFFGLDAPKLNWDDSEVSGKQWGEEKSDVWSFAIPQTNFKDRKMHPAQKPLELYKRIITTTTKPNDLILDPFAGSGTTGHAAYELGREFKLIEKNPEYVELIRERLKPVFNNGN